MAQAEDHVITILLVEDEALIRMATVSMLEDEGYRVLEGGDAEQALETLSADDSIDIVITDVQMPGKINGLELVRMITQIYPAIHTLITSGRASLSEARQSGAKKFLTKPYTAGAMQSAIQAVLAAA